MKDIYQMIKLEEFTSDMQLVANCCGIETARKLMSEMNGMSIYVPKISKLESFIKRYMIENDDKTPKEIARELNVSEIFLKKLAY